MTTNRNRIKQLFITFPKSTITKSEFLETFRKTYPIEYAKVCTESHKDGTPHLHMAVKMSSGYTKSNLLKFFAKAYPSDHKRIDIEAVRSMKHALVYISKEDQDPLIYGTYKQPITKHDRMKASFAHTCGFDTWQELDNYLADKESERLLAIINEKYEKNLRKILGSEYFKN